MEWFRPLLQSESTITLAGTYLNRLSTAFWQAPGLLQDYLNFVLCSIDPLLSRKRLATGVVAVVKETAESSTLILRPPARWAGFEAGQFINVELEIEGARFRRNYSVSCSPDDFQRTGLISITVKRVSGGKVSGYLNQSLTASELVYISEAMGQFTWETMDSVSTQGALFVAGGSGITPIKAMIDQRFGAGRFDTGSAGPVTLVHYAKNAEDILFMSHFIQLAKQNAGFTYIPHFSEQEGQISSEQLALDCPDLEDRSLFLCGPEGFMRTVQEIAGSKSVPESRIFTESFGAAVLSGSEMEQGTPGMIEFAYANRKVQSDGQRSLLELAEQAGLKPKYGCRSGICHECTCQRPQGSLVNRLTGQAIEQDQQSVQACISVPTGDLTLTTW